MKKTGLLLLIAMTVLLVAMTGVISPAAAEKNVIYISDKGTGDGSSATSPLGPETRVANNNDTTFITNDDPADDYKYYTSLELHKNSVLYQAAEKLANTGGKIVIVDEVVIDYSKTYASERIHQRDFIMPTHGINTITISGNGTGRLVMTEGAFLNLRGKTVFEDLNIITKTGRNSGDYCDNNLAICCGQYETVFGEGLVCTNETKGQTASSKYYLSISGTERYGNVNGDTKITVKSGTWNNIFGSMFGNAGNIHNGDTEINIDGGAIKGYVIGGARDNTISHFGNININITGGTINGTIYATNSTGAGRNDYTADIKITNVKLNNSTIFKTNYGTLVTGGILPKITVDMSGYTKSLTKIIPGDKVYYPAVMTSSATVSALPDSELCFMGEKYDAEGLQINVSYTNGKTAVIDYTEGDTCFGINCDSSNVGNAVVTATYGGKTVSGLSKTVKVIPSPTPKVLGAQISTQKNDGGLRFVAEMANASDGIKISDYGFYIWNGLVLSKEDYKDLNTVYGIEKSTQYGKKFRAESDSLGYYNNSQKTTFAAVYDGITMYDYKTDFIAVAYVEYTYGGKTYVRYSEPVSRNVIDVANAAVKVNYEDREWITENVINKYAEYINDFSDKKVEVYNAAESERLRDIVVAEMRANANYVWTPSTNVALKDTVTANNIKYTGYQTYVAGTKYYGMAYVNNARAELEELKTLVKTYKDGTNVYIGPIKGLEELYSSGTTPYKEVQTKKGSINSDYYDITTFFPASDYVGMIINAWNKVGTNRVWIENLAAFKPGYGRGTVAVGDYNIGESIYTEKMTSAAGTKVMYDAYSKCKRGDVLIAYTSSGGRSIYMIMEDATGTDSASTLKLMSFGTTLYDVKNGNTVVGKTHFSESSKSYSTLYSGGYIPVTIPELATGLSTKTATYINGFNGASYEKTGLIEGTLVSNKQILSVNVKLSRFDNNGEFYNKTVYCNTAKDQNVNSFKLDSFDTSSVMVNLVGGKEYTLTVNVDVADEGVKTILSYSFVKKSVNKDAYAVFYDGFDLDYSNMRQTVIDKMKEQMRVFWTPESTFTYANLTGASGFCPNTTFKAGTVYMGVLYSNMRATLADFEATLDADPTYNSTLGKNVYTLSGVSGTTDWNYVMGNHCSASMYHAYQNVIRLHASSRGNSDMHHLLLEDIFLGGISYTNCFVLGYGAEAMYESYALAQKGDFVYKRADGGHTRLIQEVVVVRNETTGRIDPDKSYALMLEQTDTLESEVYGKAANGTTDWTPASGYDSTWWEHKYSFKLMASGGSPCIILRPTEFMTNETEKHYVALTRKATKANLETAASDELGVIESNYPIIAVYATVELEDGTVLKATKRALTSTNSVNATTLFTSNATTAESAPDQYIYRPDFIGKKYTYTLEVELSVGRFTLDTLKVS